MPSRITAILLAVVMGVPLCWCCRATAAPAIVAAAEEEACPACKHRSQAQDEPATAPADAPHQERRCCAKLNFRNLSPDVAAAPRLVLVDLQAWVWLRPEFLSPLVSVEPDAAAFPVALHRARHGPPLYQRHCALLI